MMNENKSRLFININILRKESEYMRYNYKNLI